VHHPHYFNTERNIKTNHQYTTLYYSNSKSCKLRLHEAAIIRLYVSEILKTGKYVAIGFTFFYIHRNAGSNPYENMDFHLFN
jgi:hypothetical protein